MLHGEEWVLSAVCLHSLNYLYPLTSKVSLLLFFVFLMERKSNLTLTLPQYHTIGGDSPRHTPWKYIRVLPWVALVMACALASRFVSRSRTHEDSAAGALGLEPVTKVLSIHE